MVIHVLFKLQISLVDTSQDQLLKNQKGKGNYGVLNSMQKVCPWFNLHQLILKFLSQNSDSHAALGTDIHGGEDVKPAACQLPENVNKFWIPSTDQMQPLKDYMMQVQRKSQGGIVEYHGCFLVDPDLAKSGDKIWLAILRFNASFWKKLIGMDVICQMEISESVQFK